MGPLGNEEMVTKSWAEGPGQQVVETAAAAEPAAAAAGRTGSSYISAATAATDASVANM